MLSFKLFKHLLIDQFTFYCFGGGGSSGSSGGNDTLWDAQALAAKQNSAMSGEIFDYWKRYSPGYLANANAMTQEAMDGTLTNRARATAGADSDQATAQGLSAVNRSLDRYGATLNPNAMAHDATATALTSAANKAGAMSKATQWGEGQKWARNQDAYGLSSGMPGNAVGMAGTANASLSGLSSTQNSQNMMDAANARGYGQMGSAVAGGIMTAMKKDGGIIRVQKYASGGSVAPSPVLGWRERMAAMPNVSRQNNESNPATDIIGGAIPRVAAEYAKPYIKDALGGLFAPAVDTGAGVTGSLAQASYANAALPAASSVVGGEGIVGATGNGLSLAGSGATGAAAPGMVGALGTGATVGTEVGVGVGAGTAAAATATAATEGAALAGAAAANAWNPVGWILGGLALAGAAAASSKHAAGGSIRGLGTETSDSIPAMLSDGEYVLNAGAVKMLGKKQLDKVNKQGLNYRDDNKRKGAKIPDVSLRVSKGL